MENNERDLIYRGDAMKRLAGMAKSVENVCGGCEAETIRRAVECVGRVHAADINVDQAKLIRENEKLRKQNSELLADLREADMPDCRHCGSYISGENASCEDADYDCDVCNDHVCRCRTCKNNSNWIWRGERPQLSGEADYGQET